MATTFHYQHPFPLGEDKTEYYLLTKDYVSVSEFEGTPILKVEKEGLTAMANAAFRDVSFLLRRAHNEQVAKILSDPEASENDKYVALTFLRNAEVAAKGKLPLCQDTGTAIIHGEKGQQVWTGYCDEEALSLGVFKTYTEEKGVAPTETDLITYSTAYGNYQGQVMALVAEQINSASLLNDKLLACLQESYYGDVYNYDLAMDVLVNAYCKYTLANINETEVVNKLEKLVNANTPAVKEAVSSDTDGNGATEFVNSISKINVYSLISNADYKAGLDAEMQAHATIVEEYIARLCA